MKKQKSNTNSVLNSIWNDLRKSKVMPAAQARENVKKAGGSFNSILDDISNLIETLSGRGFTKITYSTNNIEDEKLKLKVIRKLKKLGYKVELDEFGIFWKISW
jgi:superoxide dismutase